jgi:hypothetical protein
MTALQDHMSKSKQGILGCNGISSTRMQSSIGILNLFVSLDL